MDEHEAEGLAGAAGEPFPGGVGAGELLRLIHTPSTSTPDSMARTPNGISFSRLRARPRRKGNGCETISGLAWR